jgi:DNA (cytosine-5)-methyltransferase 3A
MNVLSLFDGCSSGQLALERAGIHVDNYFASEIDKYAMKVTQANFPDTIQLGDVSEFSEDYLKAHNHFDDPPIDLLMGGSPCQGFSFAGHQLQFNDPRSRLFFDFVRIRDAIMPKYVLLENVRMAKKSQDVISKYMGFEPQALNSKDASAQNRYRLYWWGKLVGDTYEQIPIPPMVDKGIVMQDILEDGYATDEMTSGGKSHCLTARYNGAVWWNSIERKQRTMVLKDNPTMSKDGLIRVGTADLKGHDSIKRVYAQEGKAPTLTTMQGGHREPKVATSRDMWRKLTPLECERLQTLPDNYTNHVSNSQRYKMIGNGWTVDVIAHILKTMDVEKQYLLTDPVWDKRWTKESV